MANGEIDMKKACFGAVLSWMLVLFVGGFAQAGLYNPCEVDEGPFVSNFLTMVDEKGMERRGFQETYLKYATLNLPEDKITGLFQRRYLLVGERLSANRDKLTPTDKLSLSEYWIRRGRSLEAKLLLLPLARQPGKNFLILANLATACILQAETKQGAEKALEYREAADYLTEALSLWPTYFDELTDTDLKTLLQTMNWIPEETHMRCRTAEEYLLKLVRGRQRESVQSKGMYDAVDPLFTNDKGPVQYVNDAGAFEPGKLAKDELAKFPEGKINQAIAIVQQLLIWLPRDNRLFWQLGELYNARGTANDLRAAQRIFQELVYDRGLTQVKELKHRRAELNNFKIPEQQSGRIIEPPKEEEVETVNWRTLGVGFGAGAIVAIFAQWQIREIRRRRQSGAK